MGQENGKTLTHLELVSEELVSQAETLFFLQKNRKSFTIYFFFG